MNTSATRGMMPKSVAARVFFHGWYSRAILSRLEPIKEVTQLIHKRLDNIFNANTNAVSEGLGSKIMSLKRRTAGHRNLQRFIAAIYFHCVDSTWPYDKFFWPKPTPKSDGPIFEKRAIKPRELA